MGSYPAIWPASRESARNDSIDGPPRTPKTHSGQNLGDVGQPDARPAVQSATGQPRPDVPQEPVSHLTQDDAILLHASHTERPDGANDSLVERPAVLYRSAWQYPTTLERHDTGEPIVVAVVVQHTVPAILR